MAERQIQPVFASITASAVRGNPIGLASTVLQEAKKPDQMRPVQMSVSRSTAVAATRLAPPTCQTIWHECKYPQREPIRIGPVPDRSLIVIVLPFIVTPGSKDMTNPGREIVQILRSLQAAATLCANTFSTSQLKVEYRVAFSAGAALPWRLLEIHSRRPADDKRYALRRMHCFRTPECLRRSINERAKWKACDQELVANYLVKAHGSPDGLGGEPNRHRASCAHPSVDLRELMPARLELRAQICVTRPERVVDLLNG
jgi:hypothetical protein